MPIFDLIIKLSRSASDNNEHLTRDTLRKLLKRLSDKGTTLRVFVASSAAFGHQATTVLMVRRLIELGLNKTNLIEFYYEIDQGHSSIERMKVLIPGFDPNHPGNIYSLDGVPITFFIYDKDNPPPVSASFGITGGVDELKPLTAALNVPFFIVLQPFGWSADDYLLMGATRIKFYDKLGANFSSRSYYMSPPKVETRVWDQFIQSLPDSAESIKIARYIDGQMGGKKFDLMPIYGISDMAVSGQTPDRLTTCIGKPSDILANLAIGCYNFMAASQEKKTVVIALMTPLTEEAWLSFMKIYYRRANNYKLITLKTPELSSFKEIIEKFPTGTIVVSCMPGLPPDVFNLMIADATLPYVFEGQGTLSLALNLDKPYLKIGKRKTPSYPLALKSRDTEDFSNLVTTELTAIASCIHTMDFQWNGTYSAIMKKDSRPDNTVAPVILCDFMQDLRKYEFHPYNIYFKRMSGFYHDETNDRLLLALIYSLNSANLLAEGFRLGEGKLQGLHQKLLDNTKEGTLNLIPGAIDTGVLLQFMKAIMSGSLFEIGTPGKPVHIDFPDPYDKITVKGSASGLDNIGLEVDFTFTIENEALMTQVGLKGPDFQFNQVPWFELKDFQASVTVSESGNYIHGTIGCDLVIDQHPVHFSVEYPQTDDLLVFTGNLDAFKPSINSVFQLFGGISFLSTLPPPLNVAADLSLQQIQIGYDMTQSTISAFNLALETTKPWPLFGKLSLEKLSIQIFVTEPTTTRQVAWVGSSSFKIGPGTIEAEISYPGWVISTALAKDSAPIPVGDLLTFFLSDKVTLDLGANLSSFSMQILPGQNGAKTTYALTAELDTPSWNLTLNNVTFGIKDLGVNIDALGEETTGTLSGTFALFMDEPEEIQFLLSAAYLGKGNGWLFKGQQGENPIKAKLILQKYVSSSWTDGVPDVDVSEIAFSIQSPGEGEGKDAAREYEISGKVKVWNTPLGDSFSSTITAKFGYKNEDQQYLDFIEYTRLPISLVAQDATAGPYGEIKAELSWCGIELTIFYNYNPTYKAYGIQWGSLIGKIEEKEVNKKKCQVATLSFTKSTTIGSMVETMVGWATGSKYSLGAPWNILDSIALNNLQLTYNFTDKQVSFLLNLSPIEIGILGINIATITGISLSYQSNQPDPADNGVKVELLGTFLWQEDPSKPLGWDATKPETTPAPPAQGNKYLDLRMLAMGQHVDVKGLSSATSVSQAIKIMKDLPDPEPGKIPPVKLNPNNGWLVGLDMGLLRISKDTSSFMQPAANPADYVFNLQIVFSDPNLYGLRIALNGDAAKVFKGLQFEIMYRQISQSVGVYQSEITLPDVMRYIRLGQFNMVLPVFGIQVYTNGDFQVDLGFPWNANFSRSFTLQTLIYVPIPIPVMGSIGLYFARLSSATTTKVPASKKGIFNPVVAFGVGFQIGLGYDFNIGILSAGFSLTVVTIIEGVIAKWNPYLPAAGGQKDRIETDYYFSIRGTVGIIGKLYGTVDFAIIKASVNIEISVIAQFYFAPYEPIELNMRASVRASASIKIVFITISFSFSLTIEHHLTLPAIGGTAPWSDGTERLSLAQHRRLERGILTAQLLQHRLMRTAVVLNWNNLQPAATPVDLEAHLILGLTAAMDENELVPTLVGQKACGVAVMMIASVKAPQDDQVSCKLKAVDPAADTSFEKLSKQVFRWVVAAFQAHPVTKEEVDNLIVTRVQLENALAYLSDAAQFIHIPESAINTFMETQFLLKVKGPAEEKDGVDADATYFPIIPSVGFSLKQSTAPEPLSYTYAAYNSSSSDYLAALRIYFDELSEHAGARPASSFSLDDADGPSIGTIVFSDYFALLAKQMLQMAVGSLKNYVYQIQINQDAQDIIDWVNNTGGLSGGLTYNLEKLFSDNKSHGLRPNKGLTITGSTYVIQTDDSFETIAGIPVYGGGLTAKGLALKNLETSGLLKADKKITYPGKQDYPTLPGQTIDNIAKELKVSASELLDKSNILTIKGLLIPAATLQVPDFNYNTKEKDNLNDICTSFGVTLELLSDVPSNSKIKDLFATTESADLNIVQLPQFRVAELIQEIQYTQGLQHLAGLTSRYYMAGLRLPTKGLTPKYPGMWVTVDQKVYRLPESAGLYALSGQQFPMPKLSAIDSADLVFTNNDCKWISFDGKPTLTIHITPDSTQYKEALALTAFANANYLDVGLTSLGSQELFTIESNTYTFNSAVNWASPSGVPMPYLQYQGEAQSLRLWKIPDSLLNLPDLSVHKTNPFMSIELGVYDEATQEMKYSSFANYGWGTQVDFTIKKIPTVPGSPTTETTYEVVGADGFNTLLLERLVGQIGDNESLISSLHIAFAQPQTEGNGIQTDNQDHLTIGLAQVNLTTVTAPPTSSLEDAGLPAGQKNLIPPTEFIRLLWEASITAQGGYYLYYYNDESKAGLPDAIFDDQGNAQLSLVVLFSISQTFQVCSYMNVLATASAVDFSSHTLFAKTLKENFLITADAGTSLSGIARDYFADIDQIAENNKLVPLRKGVILAIHGGIYEVRNQAPGGKLNDIATYFGISADAIRDANPQITYWENPLPIFTPMYLPGFAIVVGTNNGGNSFDSIANYFGLSISGLVIENKDIQGIFEFGKPIGFSSGPLSAQATVKQGNMAVKAIRKAAQPVNDNPSDPDFALHFLRNNFSLLGYRVNDNAFFRLSNISLPICPSTPEDASADSRKFALPKQLGADDLWHYTDSLPYTKLVKLLQLSDPDLPSAEDNPYQGLGSLLQIGYSWQDIYGNSLLTTLDNVQDGKNPNCFPILIKYYDSLIGLSRWPSVSSNWKVNKTIGQPVLSTILNFDASAYDGLLIVKVTADNTLTAIFTNELDATSAKDPANYSFSEDMQISVITLDADGKSVQIVVNSIPQDIPIALEVKDIQNKEKTKQYAGSASFSTSPAIAPTSTIMTKAGGDKLLYEQIWYQLNDENGIKLLVNTSLVPSKDFVLDKTQTTHLIQVWVAPIYKFVESRGLGKNTGEIPDLQHEITFSIDPESIESKDVFKLTLDFTLERTSKHLAGSAGADILLASTSIVALSELSGNSGNNYTRFVADFEAAFSGDQELKIAGGVDRFDAQVLADSTLWVVRLNNGSLKPSIGFEVNKQEAPILFAPRPVANQLISRTGVDICPLDPQRGLDCAHSVKKDFIDVDINLWCNQLFGSFDDLLSPVFTTCIQIVDFRNKAAEPNATNFFDLLTDQKELLADILKDLMVPVFEDQATYDASDIREDFKQALLVKLSNAYSVQSGLQFSAIVYDNNLDTAAFLYGTVAQQEGTTAAKSGQNIQFTAPKISLKPDAHAGVRFLMSAPQLIKGEKGEVLSVIDLSLSYSVTAIEHQIGELPGIKDYKASSWLQFFSKDSSILSPRPLSDKPVTVPLPLNVFPTVPGMTKQSGQLSDDQSNTPLSELLDWNYLFSYSQSFHYPQDILHFAVQFNLTTIKLDGLSGFPDAFREIAQFISVLPEMNEALSALSLVDMGSDADKIASATTTLTAYTGMMDKIIKQSKANGLQVQQYDLRKVTSSEGPFPFEVKEGIATIEGTDGVLLVSVGIKAVYEAAIGIPEVLIDGYKTLAFSPCEQGFHCYYYKSLLDNSPLLASKGQTIALRTVVLKSLNILGRQDAAVSVYMDRNAVLVPGRNTNPDFVFTTGKVEFPNYYYPNFVRVKAIDIAAISTGKPVKATLKEHLTTLFNALLQKNKQSKLSFNVITTYDYQVNPMGIELQLPVMMQPIRTFNLGDHPNEAPGEMLDNWVDVIGEWLKTASPSPNNARFNFNLYIFSNLTQEPRPLIQLSNLYVELKYIS